jgi:hypothetical protein
LIVTSRARIDATMPPTALIISDQELNSDGLRPMDDVVELTATLLLAAAIFVGGAMSGTSPVILGALQAVQVAGGMVFRFGQDLSAAGASAPPTSFTTCDQLRSRYPHGVGLPRAHDRVSGNTRPVITFAINAPVYRANHKRLDRDHDGIACERR